MKTWLSTWTPHLQHTSIEVYFSGLLFSLCFCCNCPGVASVECNATFIWFKKMFSGFYCYTYWLFRGLFQLIKCHFNRFDPLSHFSGISMFLKNFVREITKFVNFSIGFLPSFQHFPAPYLHDFRLFLKIYVFYD